MKKKIKLVKSSLAISKDTTLVNETGSWRTSYPIYENKIPPCQAACPAGENIAVWIDLVKRGKFEEAWQEYTKNNPFPAVCGYVCYKFCEKNCNRKYLDEKVEINSIERFLGEFGLEKNLKPIKEINPKIANIKVAIVGAGPAGLALAYFLGKLGAKITVFEANKRLGGLLRFGIPHHRLPKKILEKEIENNILSLEINFKFEKTLGENLLLKDLEREFDYIFIATGAPKSRKINIEGEEFALEGLAILKAINEGQKIDVGNKILIIGGGNTAIDAARSVKKLDKKREVEILYRRSKEEMPAHKEEVEWAKNEGVKFQFLSLPTKIAKTTNGLTINCVKMKLGEADETGRKKPIPIKDSEFKIKADSVIMAIGEKSNLSDLINDKKLDVSGKSENSVIIAGGDAFTGPKSVIEAIGSGKAAANFIKNLILGESPDKKDLEIVTFDKLNLDYFNPQPKLIPLGLRNYEWKIKEAERCFSCGVCTGCDNCVIFCPDAVIIKRGDKKYRIDYDYCKGCGICARECPRAIIDMKEE